jgi:hypothetical protein
MRSIGLLQMAGGVVAAGVVAAGATAVTGSGMVWGGSGTGTATQFVGGTLTQSVTGASVTAVAYLHADAAKTQTNSIAMTISGANTRYLTMTPSGGAWSAGPDPVADEWKCTGDIAAPVAGAAPKVQLNASPATVTCVPQLASGPTVQGYYSGLSSLAMAITLS